MAHFCNVVSDMTLQKLAMFIKGVNGEIIFL